MKKQTIVFLLIFCFILSILTSCQTGTPSDTTKATDSTTQGDTGTPYEETIPKRDYNNAEFHILISTQMRSFFDIDADKKEVTSLSTAVYNRNKKVEEQFKVKLVYEAIDGNRSGSEAFATKVRTSASSGDNVYDIVCPQAYYGSLLAFEDCYYNLRASEYIHWEQPWWYQTINNNGTIDGKLYCAAGAVLMDKIGSAMCLYFNKGMLENYGSTSDQLYQLATEGKWTYDAMNNLAKLATDDVDNNGIFDEKDLYGFVSDKHGARAMVTGSETPITKVNADGTVSLVYMNEHLVKVFETYFDFYHQNNYTLICQDAEDFATKAFVNDRALFYVHDIGKMTIADMREMSSDYGVLPIPKFDEAQSRYYTASMRWDLVSILAPADTERASIILEAMCYETYKSVIPAYWEQTVQYKYARDEKSVAMLELVRSSLFYDFAEFFNTSLGSINDVCGNLLASKNPNLSSWWASNETRVTKLLQTLFENYQALD